MLVVKSIDGGLIALARLVELAVVQLIVIVVLIVLLLVLLVLLPKCERLLEQVLRHFLERCGLQVAVAVLVVVAFGKYGVQLRCWFWRPLLLRCLPLPRLGRRSRRRRCEMCWITGHILVVARILQKLPLVRVMQLYVSEQEIGLECLRLRHLAVAIVVSVYGSVDHDLSLHVPLEMIELVLTLQVPEELQGDAVHLILLLWRLLLLIGAFIHEGRRHLRHFAESLRNQIRRTRDQAGDRLELVHEPVVLLPLRVLDHLDPLLDLPATVLYFLDDQDHAIPKRTDLVLHRESDDIDLLHDDSLPHREAPVQLHAVSEKVVQYLL